MKRIAKLVTFGEAMDQMEEESQISRLTGKLWDMVHALGRALQSITEDEDTDDDAKGRLVQKGYDDFLSGAKFLLDDPAETLARTAPDVGDVHVESAKHPTGGKKKKGKKTPPMFRSGFDVAKVDPDKRLVFGWASIVERGGEPVVDKQGDIIEPEEMEKAAYDFVLDARVAGDNHEKIGVGRLVESCFFDAAKTEAMEKSLTDRGIDNQIVIKAVGWWVGFHIDDDQVWKDIKSGKSVAFSIGGRATVEELEAA
jgi:hypothetical protein